MNLGILAGRLVAVDHHLVSRLPAGDSRSDLPNDPGGVGAADVMAPFRVISVGKDRHRLALGRPYVVVVDPRRHDSDDHLERARLGHLDLLELEGVQRLALALGADYPRRHGAGELAGLGFDYGNLAYVDGHSDPSVGNGLQDRSYPALTGPRERGSLSRARRPRVPRVGAAPARRLALAALSQECARSAPRL